MHTLFRWFAPLLFLVSTTAWSARETQWTVIELNAPSASFTVATAVNNRGEVAGWFNEPCPERGTCERPFLWDGSFRTLPTPADVTHVRVRGINDSGTVVGHTTLFGTQAIAWMDGAFTRLGFEGEAIRINRKGHIACTVRVGGLPRACLLRDGVLYELGTFGGMQSVSAELNDRGQVVGSADLANGTRHAFIWENGRMTDLGTLGGAFSSGNSINDRGVAVGSAQEASGQSRPFEWSGGTMTALAGAPSAGTAYGVNDRGTVIGHNGTKAWVLDDGVLTYLDDLPAVRAKGVTFMIPTDINERGWIVAWGTTPAGTRGYVLIPK